MEIEQPRPLELPSARSWGQYATISDGILGLLLLLFLMYLFTVRRIAAPGLRLPPGPPGLPVIGHLLYLGRLPHESLAKLAGKYGPLMSLRFGSVRTVVVTSPDMARECLKTHDRVLASRPRTIPAEVFMYNCRDIALAPMDDNWRYLRKISTLNLLTNKRIERYQEERRQEILGTVGRLLEHGRDGQLADIDTSLVELGFNYITRVLFSKAFYNHKRIHTDVKSSNEAKRFDSTINEFTSVGFFLIGEFIPFLRKFDIGGAEAKLRKLFIEFDHFLTGIVDDHRKKHESKVQNTGTDGQLSQEDFLDVLLSMQSNPDGESLTDIQIKVILQDMIIGGTGTVSSVEAWAMAELMRHPEVRHRIQRELDDVVGKERLVNESDLVNLKYLQAMVKETLRLHPSLPLLVPHYSIAATEIAGYTIPENTRVIINAYAIARDPQLWEDPSTFNPDRFMNSTIDSKGQDFQFLPFSSGRRICPGLNLATLMLEHTLAQLLHACEFSLPPGMRPEDVDMEEAFGMLSSRSNHLKLYARPRLASTVYTAAGITV